MLNCHEVTRLASERQERSLIAREKLELKMHLLMCRGCRNFVRHMQTLSRITRAYAQGEGAADSRIDGRTNDGLDGDANDDRPER